MSCVRPTLLVGTSTIGGAFTEAIVREMATSVDRPIVFPLSNPTERHEATPEQLLRWTKGRALVATGAPFPSVELDGTTYEIGQANNALLYPGLGLGAIVARARRISDGMFAAAAQAVAAMASPTSRGASLLPPVENLRAVSARVAADVATTAASEGLAAVAVTDAVRQVGDAMWEPRYPDLRPA